MNERLKELTERAGFTLHQTENLSDFYVFNKEKFAELLLEDVMSICEDLGDRGMDGHYCVDAIRKEFGLRP